MEALNNHYQFLLFLSSVLSIGAQSSGCAPGIESVGITVPKGDIRIEYGSPLQIFCVLDPLKTNLNSSSLVFYNNEVKYSDDYVKIINATTLRLYDEKPPIKESLVSCKLRLKNRNQGVCLNYVFVGTAPQEVKNFSCVALNWESLNCTWIPEKNPVKTIFKLSFSLRPNKRKIYYACPGNTDHDHNFCFWNSSTNPPHRMPYEMYYFKLTGSNIFGNLTKTYTIHHYAVVLPSKPENLSLVDATSSSITISWSLPLALKVFPGGIRSKVVYQSRYEAEQYRQFQEANMDNLLTNDSGHSVLNITNLKYPHTKYDIRVLLKSTPAEDSEKWWSEPTYIFVNTKPAVPGMPPKTDMGSFESTAIGVDHHHRKIFIYWQQIPRSQENGENFGYNITSIEEVINGVHYQRNEVPAVIQKTYALFKKMTYNTYIFKIVSQNKEGVSKNYSTIIVPSKAKSPAEPVSFTKIAYDHGVYELSWNAPELPWNAPARDFSSDRNNIQSYTIFWCDNKKDAPYQCNGVLNWTHVDNNVTEKNITLPDDKIFQFAISANTYNSSSGMVWADCTVLPDQERGKLKNLWINKISSTFMELKWKLDCLRQRSIRNYEVTYCPIVGPQDANCRDGKFEQKTFDGNQTHYIISNLRPYTTYKVFLALSSSKGVIKSDALQNTTMEAVPDGRPENLKAIDVTNSSITLTWSPPTSLNGVLRYYEVSMNDSPAIRVDKQLAGKYTLKGLSSYENYLIKVVACTVACSNRSADLLIRTKIGIPGQLNAPSVEYYNNTDLNVTWLPLKNKRGGKNDYYEIQIEISTAGQEVLNTTIKEYNNTKETHGKQNDLLQVLTPGCEEAHSDQRYKVEVRVVNLAEGGLARFVGPWSASSTGFCRILPKKTKPSESAFWLLYVLASIMLFMTLGYATRCTWKRYKAMQNIRVKLPPELELNMYKGEVIDLPMSQHIPHQKPPLSSDNNDTPPPNQPLLPEKKEKEESVESSNEDCEETNGERESSGCGSGHDSVSSSISAGTHITDSGTEADERPEDVFGDSPRRDVYARQRNASRSGSGGDGYSILAQAPSGYVSLPPISGYVKHDWTPNAKGYDMAGSVNSPNPPPGNETSWAT